MIVSGRGLRLFRMRTTRSASPKKEPIPKEKKMSTKKQFVAAAAVLSVLVTIVPLFADDDDSPKFNMVVSAGGKVFLPNPRATGGVTSAAPPRITHGV